MKTHSIGVRRLSLIAGVVGCAYAISHPGQNILWDFIADRPSTWKALTATLLYWVGAFVACWLIVRIAAWIVSGFLKDREMARKRKHLLELARDVATKTTDDYTPTDSWTDQDWNLFLAGSASPHWEQVVKGM